MDNIDRECEQNTCRCKNCVNFSNEENFINFEDKEKFIKLIDDYLRKHGNI